MGWTVTEEMADVGWRSLFILLFATVHTDVITIIDRHIRHNT